MRLSRVWQAGGLVAVGGYEERVAATTVETVMVMVQDRQLMGKLADRWVEREEHEAGVDVLAVSCARM